MPPKIDIIPEDGPEHADYFGSSPSLQLSSDEESNSSSGQDEVSARDDGISSSRLSPSSTLSRETLAKIARLHLNARDEQLPTGSALEARSTLSSPGKFNFTLRERLGRLSRNQRKDLLASKQPSNEASRNPERSTLQQNPSIVSSPSSSIPSNPSLHTSLTMSDSIRMKRQAQYSHRGAVPDRNNYIKLHVYDLIAKDTLMRLPWGCMCEIGKCFNEMNDTLHELGTGAYHVGVEVNGYEYAFGATNKPGRTGVFSCIPKCSPGYQYRKTIEFKPRPLIRKSWVKVNGTYQEVEEYVEGRNVLKEMVPEYMGIDYDILRKNCCTFARDVCLRMGVEDDEIPSWFGNLAQSGAITQDIAYSTVEPLCLVISQCEDDMEEPEVMLTEAKGFEIISRPGSSGRKDIIVVDAKRHSGVETGQHSDDLRRTSSWTY